MFLELQEKVIPFSQQSLLTGFFCGMGSDDPLEGSSSPELLLSVDHGSYDTDQSRPLFLEVKPGMTVVVRHDFLPGETQDKDWWMGHVIHCTGGARKPEHHNILQIADVDTGEIRWVNADLLTHIVPQC